MPVPAGSSPSSRPLAALPQHANISRTHQSTPSTDGRTPLLAHPTPSFQIPQETYKLGIMPRGSSSSSEEERHHNGGASGGGGTSRSNIPRWVPAGGAELYEELTWSKHRPKMSRAKKIRLSLSYLPDWVITLLLAGLLALINDVHGFRREFSLTDTSLQHTYATKERVPVPLLVVLAFVIPLILQGLISLGISRSVWDFHASLLGLVLAHALTVTVTTLVKVCVGRPRPDIIDRCQPIAGARDGVPYGLVTDAICSVSTTSHIVTDGFRSFPSGHSSTAFAGLTFFALYLSGKLHLFGRRSNPGSNSSAPSQGRAHVHALSAWIALTPLVGATLIAVSRTMDYRHHATDVIAGALLGFSIARGVYALYYPPLSSDVAHKPWAPRAEFGRGNEAHSEAGVTAAELERGQRRREEERQEDAYFANEQRETHMDHQDQLRQPNMNTQGSGTGLIREGAPMGGH